MSPLEQLRIDGRRMSVSHATDMVCDAARVLEQEAFGAYVDQVDEERTVDLLALTGVLRERVDALEDQLRAGMAPSQDGDEGPRRATYAAAMAASVAALRKATAVLRTAHLAKYEALVFVASGVVWSRWDALLVLRAVPHAPLPSSAIDAMQAAIDDARAALVGR